MIQQLQQPLEVYMTEKKDEDLERDLRRMTLVPSHYRWMIRQINEAFHITEKRMYYGSILNSVKVRLCFLSSSGRPFFIKESCLQ